MEYPKRNLTHIIEKQSLEILTQHLPSQWIVREMTERDYGIDLYVEVIGRDCLVTGDLIAIQVKGKSEIKFNSDENFSFYKIKKSTLAYWLSLPVPVFLVVVCVTTKRSFWCNVKEKNRNGEFIEGKSNTFHTKINVENGLNRFGLIKFQANYFREKNWGRVENAIENSLMLFTSLGPFILMCMRSDDERICSTTVQYILLQHYEYYYLMRKYLFGKHVKPISYWYDTHNEQIKDTQYRLSATFTYGTVKELIKYFIFDYRDSIRHVNLLVVRDHAAYYEKKFPYLYMHLLKRPLTFVHEDWISRYYFDEYEYETTDIEEKYFEDFTDYDNHDLINDLNF